MLAVSGKLRDIDRSECDQDRPGFGEHSISQKLRAIIIYIVVQLLGQFSKETVRKTASSWQVTSTPSRQKVALDLNSMNWKDVRRCTVLRWWWSGDVHNKKIPGLFSASPRFAAFSASFSSAASVQHLQPRRFFSICSLWRQNHYIRIRISPCWDVSIIRRAGWEDLALCQRLDAYPRNKWGFLSACLPHW